MTGVAGIFAALCLLMLTGCAKDTQPQPAPLTLGTMTVEADISKGSRFRVYCNDVWTAPEMQTVVPGERTKYSFPLPATLRTLRLDPSEAADSHVVIYSITLHLPGMPAKKLPFNELPGFLKYRCNVKVAGSTAVVDASGADMYFMGSVNPASYPVAD